jgi:cell division protein FtsI/penicillin-binding protein 2
MQMIQSTLDQMITPGARKYNYLGFFTNELLLQAIKDANLPCISIKNKYYIYIDPTLVGSVKTTNSILADILRQYSYEDLATSIDIYTQPQNNNYVKLVTALHPTLAQTIIDLKKTYTKVRNAAKEPLLHGLGLESYPQRYYPFGSFMSHILGYVSKQKVAFYGVEQYFDEILAGNDGNMSSRSSKFLGQLGANDFSITQAKNGLDVYLTIDPMIQKETEKIVKKYYAAFRADSVSALVYDPYSGHIIASVNAPDFDPNNYNAVYDTQLLDETKRYILDDPTHVDMPVYIQT